MLVRFLIAELSNSFIKLSINGINISQSTYNPSN